MLSALVFVLALTRPVHVTLRSNAAATFPLVSRFGVITIDLYPRGFRAKSVWLRGFAINGQNTLTVENPISRMYTRMPMSGIGDIARFIGGKPVNIGPPRNVVVTSGSVGKLPARRYRIVYSANDYVDVWTTAAGPPAPAFRACVDELVRVIAPQSALLLRRIPDTPLFVELNIGPYRKVALLQVAAVAHSSAGEADALRVSPWMFPAPFGTIFK